MIQESFVNMENMLDLLDEPQEVKDADNALPLVAHGGKLQFDDVCFSYHPERPILKHVSFVAEPGQTVALVGLFIFIIQKLFIELNYEPDIVGG